MSGPMCPRCGGFIPSNDAPGSHPGALSRTDDTTEVCSSCGVEEALDQMEAGGARPSRDGWVRP